MRVTPKTETEIAEMSLLPVGWYPAEVLDSEERMSKKGNEMLVNKVRVFTQSGGSAFIDDFIVESEFTARKLRHLADTFGILADYEAGNMDPAAISGKPCWVKVGIQKSKEPQFPDRNTIYDYAAKAPEVSDKTPVQAVRPPEVATPGLDGDEIPF